MAKTAPVAPNLESTGGETGKVPATTAAKAVAANTAKAAASAAVKTKKSTLSTRKEAADDDDVVKVDVRIQCTGSLKALIKLLR